MRDIRKGPKDPSHEPRTHPMNDASPGAPLHTRRQWLQYLPYLSLTLFLAAIAALVWLTRAHDADEQRTTDQRRAVDGAEPALHLDRNEIHLREIGPELFAARELSAQTRGPPRRPARPGIRPRPHPVAVARGRAARHHAAARARTRRGDWERAHRGRRQKPRARSRVSPRQQHRPPGLWRALHAPRRAAPLRSPRPGVDGRGAARGRDRRVFALGPGRARAAVVVLRALPGGRARRGRQGGRRQVQGRAAVGEPGLHDALRPAGARAGAADHRLQIGHALGTDPARRLDPAAGRHHRVERDPAAPPARPPPAGRARAARGVRLSQGDGRLHAHRHARARPRRPPQLRELRLLPHDRLRPRRARRAQPANCPTGTRNIWTRRSNCTARS